MKETFEIRSENLNGDFNYWGDQMHILAPDEGRIGTVRVWQVLIQTATEPELAARGPWYNEASSFLSIAHALYWDLPDFSDNDDYWSENRYEIEAALRKLYYDYQDRATHNVTAVNR